MRRVPLLLVLLAAAVFPSSALAVTPLNDEATGASPITPTYVGVTPVSTTIPPNPGAGGWEDATTSNNPSLDPIPTCVGAVGFYSLWYVVTIGEPSVISVSVSTASQDFNQFQPVVTVLSTDLTHEFACGRGSSDSQTTSVATASSYLATGRYYIRVASVAQSQNGNNASPAPPVYLTAQLRDVTPPAISVAIPAKIVGAGQKFTFDATNSTDAGSTIDWASAVWSYHENGGAIKTVPAPAGATAQTAGIGTYAWKTAGFHEVSLTLKDMAGNGSTYDFFVYVHSFVLPKVTLHVTVPLPGASSIHFVLSHSVPINVRLVIFQGGKLLRAIPQKLVKGTRKNTKLVIALKSRVKKKGGEITISGMASTLGTYPNSVPLTTCAVDPVTGSGKCA
jgi:hypothetical protein